jgi:HD-like signal output (HDOD) protein
MSMGANGKNNQSRTPVGRKASSSHVPQPPYPGSAPQLQLPAPPVTPKVLLLFQMLLSNEIADLSAITELIRTDIGLTVNVLRSAAEEVEGQNHASVDIEDIVVQLGLDKLKKLVDDIMVLSIHPRGSAGLRTFDRFSMHARLTALIAEELAGETASVNQEEAYVAGLLRHIGALPFVLGWKIPELEEADIGEIGYYLAKVWRLPDRLTEVIRGNRETCDPSTLPLFDIVTAADKHAFRLEVGYDSNVSTS